MHYEINIALNGMHFFGTHERSIRDDYALKRVYGEMKKRFPESEGFSVTVCQYRTSGRSVNPDDIKLF